MKTIRISDAIALVLTGLPLSALAQNADAPQSAAQPAVDELGEIVVTGLRASLRDALPYRGAPYDAPCFILVGNESRGLPEGYEAACDLRVTMPMKGRADSLNAAVAAAVLAYEVLASLES